jgi:tetratricopeptide (TPR) repeat protein
MKPARIFQIFFFMAWLLIIGTAGWAKFGISKTRVTFLLRHPPMFFTPAREVMIEVTASDPNGIPLSHDFHGLLEQALLEEGFKPVASAQTIVGITIRDADSRVRQDRRVESVNVRTGTHTETDKKGKSKEVEDCKVKDSRVTYLVSAGRLALTFQATDAKTQGLLASENIERTYQMESAVSGPPQCGGKEFHLKGDQIADSYAILHGLAEQAIPRIVQLTAGFDEARTVLLAVDDELKPGNTEALAGNWQGAFDVWTQANIAKQDTEAARQYNLGVADEALAALAMKAASLDEATRHLNDAEICYRKALQLDADEKYFRDTLARLQSDREILQSEQALESMKPGSDASRAQIATTESNQLSLGFPIDGWPDGEPAETHNFRAYVRQRMVVRGLDKVDDNFKQQLAADGNDYQVKPGVATQVVESEVNRLLIANQNVLKYQDLIRDLAGDAVISKDERAILETRRKTLHLSTAEARKAEAQFQFREE